MKVLVTGGAGHLGANLLRRLQADGDVSHSRARAARATTTRASPRLASRWSTATCAISTRCARPCKGIDRIYHVAAQISTVAGKEQRALPEQRHRHQEPPAGGARKPAAGASSSPAASAPPAATPTARPPTRRCRSTRSSTTCRTRCRSRRSSSSACAPSPKGRTWSSPRRAPSSGRTTTCRRAWARVLCDFANGKLRAYIPGGFEFVAARDICEGHVLAMQKGRTGHKYIISSGFQSMDDIMGIMERVTGKQAPAPPAGVGDGGDRADDAARAVDAVSVADAAPDAGRDPHPAAGAQAPIRARRGASSASRRRRTRTPCARPTNSSSRAARSQRRAQASRRADGHDDARRPTKRAPPIDSLARAYEFLAEMQHPTGYWEAEMVWNSMLLSQWVIVQKIVGRLDAIPDDTRARILKQYEITRTPEGGWGMHGEGGPYVFMTALAYVALRLLGLPPEHPLCAPARDWLQSQPGGVRAIPTWGKFWLSMLGLYEYEGVNPIPPELFLLPDWVPLHPNNYYCHTRYIYLGIAYLYGRRFKCEIGADSRRAPSRIIWLRIWRDRFRDAPPRYRAERSARAAEPAAARHLRRARRSTRSTRCALLRERALRHCFERIVYEQEASRGQGLVAGQWAARLPGALRRAPSALRVVAAGDGVVEVGGRGRGHPLLRRALDLVGHGVRHARDAGGAGARGRRADAVGGAAQGVRLAARRADAGASCRRLRARAARADRRRLVLLRRRAPLGGERLHRRGDDGAARGARRRRAHRRRSARIADERLEAAARFILRRQNERRRLRQLRVAPRQRDPRVHQPVGDVRQLHDRALVHRVHGVVRGRAGALSRALPGDAARRDRSRRSRAASRCLRSRQLADGSYLGFWGVNFTYAIFHVVEALRAAGVPATDPAIARAIEWLLAQAEARRRLGRALEERA